MSTPPLEHPNNLHLSAAQGWIELGNSLEASSELAKIPIALRDHPEVLQVRWNVEMHARRLQDALETARVLHRISPSQPAAWIHQAFTLHELKRTREAWEALLPAAGLFPAEWLVCYNLACYACQLGWIEEAKRWLMQSIERGDPIEINGLAAKDPDLKPLVGRI